MSAKAEADSTTQKPEAVEPKKLSPYKQRRKEDRDLKFNRSNIDTSIIEDQDSTNPQVQQDDEMSDIFRFKQKMKNKILPMMSSKMMRKWPIDETKKLLRLSVSADL